MHPCLRGGTRQCGWGWNNFLSPFVAKIGAWLWSKTPTRAWKSRSTATALTCPLGTSSFLRWWWALLKDWTWKTPSTSSRPQWVAIKVIRINIQVGIFSVSGYLSGYPFSSDCTYRHGWVCLGELDQCHPSSQWWPSTGWTSLALITLSMMIYKYRWIFGHSTRFVIPSFWSWPSLETSWPVGYELRH